MSDDKLPLHAPMPGHLVRRCHQISVGLFHEVCGETGLTPIQFAILSGIEFQPGLEQVQLSKLAGVDRTTIGNVLSRLESRGYIERRPDDKDRRIKRLFMTAEGSGALHAIRPLVEQVQDLLLAPLEEDERKEFTRLLIKLVLGNNEGSRAPMDISLALG